MKLGITGVCKKPGIGVNTCGGFDTIRGELMVRGSVRHGNGALKAPFARRRGARGGGWP